MCLRANPPVTVPPLGCSQSLKPDYYFWQSQETFQSPSNWHRNVKNVATCLCNTQYNSINPRCLMQANRVRLTLATPNNKQNELKPLFKSLVFRPPKCCCRVNECPKCIKSFLFLSWKLCFFKTILYWELCKDSLHDVALSFWEWMSCNIILEQQTSQVPQDNCFMSK